MSKSVLKMSVFRPGNEFPAAKSAKSACADSCFSRRRPTSRLSSRDFSRWGKFSARTKRGFTLIEVLVTILLVAFVLTATMSAIRYLGAADSRAQEADRLQQLAKDKLDELLATEDPQSLDQSGDFSEEGYPTASWTLTIETTDVTNVSEIKFTAKQGKEEQDLTELLYIPPTTGSTGQ